MAEDALEKAQRLLHLRAKYGVGKVSLPPSTITDPTIDGESSSNLPGTSQRIVKFKSAVDSVLDTKAFEKLRGASTGGSGPRAAAPVTAADTGLMGPPHSQAPHRPQSQTSHGPHSQPHSHAQHGPPKWTLMPSLAPPLTSGSTAEQCSSSSSNSHGNQVGDIAGRKAAYRRLRQIGSGRFGEVYFCQQEPSSSPSLLSLLTAEPSPLYPQLSLSALTLHSSPSTRCTCARRWPRRSCWCSSLCTRRT